MLHKIDEEIWWNNSHEITFQTQKKSIKTSEESLFQNLTAHSNTNTFTQYEHWANTSIENID